MNDDRHSESHRSEPGDCSDAELMDAIGQLHAAHCAIHARLLTLMAEYDRREAYRQDGTPSMAEWSAACLGLSRRTGSLWAEVAAALETLPHVAQAYANGKLSLDQIVPLLTLAGGDNEAELLEQAMGMSAAALERAACDSRVISDREAAHARDRRRLTWRYHEASHSLRLNGWLFDADGAVVVKCLETLASHYPKDPATGTYEPFPVRCADALVELYGGELSEQPDSDRATVVVHVDEATLTGGEGAGTIESGPAIGAETARRLACDATIERVVDDKDGKPVSIGRRSRSIPPYMMRALRHRDHTCRFPGCNRKGYLQGHHERFWEHGGETSLDNLVLLCRFHHSLLHEGGWSMQGDPWGGLEFRNPFGAVLATGPPGLRPEVVGSLPTLL